MDQGRRSSRWHSNVPRSPSASGRRSLLASGRVAVPSKQDEHLKEVVTCVPPRTNDALTSRGPEGEPRRTRKLHSGRWPGCARSPPRPESCSRGRRARHRDLVGGPLQMSDGRTYVPFRHTRRAEARWSDAQPPAVLQPRFHLELLPARRSSLHALFRAVCIVTTPFFVGLRGFRSKLWMVDPETGDFAGLYEWDDDADGPLLRERSGSRPARAVGAGLRQLRAGRGQDRGGLPAPERAGAGHSFGYRGVDRSGCGRVRGRRRGLRHQSWCAAPPSGRSSHPSGRRRW